MSWHFSQALVEEFLARNCLTGKQCVQLKLSVTAERSSFGVRKKDKSTPFLSGMTLEPSMVDHGMALWMSSLQASRVSHSVLPGRKKASRMTEICGQIPFALLEKSGPDSACWKTSQVCLQTHTLEPFSGKFPRAGMMQDGKCYRLPKLERRIKEIGSGFTQRAKENPNQGRLFPTPSFSAARQGQNDPDGKRGQTLVGAARGQSWPTPQSKDWKSGNVSDQVFSKNARPLNEHVKRWPTPDGQNHRDGSKLRNSDTKKGEKAGFNRHQVSLHHAIHLNQIGGPEIQQNYPTPQAHDSTKGNAARVGRFGTKHGGRNLNDEIAKNEHLTTGQLNPEWVEWLMGWPIGWTGLEPLATDRFQRWLELHGISSQEK